MGDLLILAYGALLSYDLPLVTVDRAAAQRDSAAVDAAPMEYG